MSDASGFQELLFFLADDLTIEVEMPLAEFDAVQMGAASLSTLAGRTLKAVYVAVGDALVVHGMVLFQLIVDGQGRPSGFNLPLRHLHASAGPGPDLGHGPIRLASRTQCPIPWHQRQMWHTEDTEALRRLQHAVFHNASGLIPRRTVSITAPDPASVGGVVNSTITPSGIHADALRVELSSLRDKLRTANEELARLKAALAHEQDRNRRLQDRLLGNR